MAWHPLGWQPAWFAEIDPFCSAVLRYRYSSVPNLGDFTKIGVEHGTVDLLVGGTPCQSFSVAGKRAGLDDPRGVLAFEFVALARRLRPRWIVFENVPGILSSNRGRDFGAWLGALGECGYGFAYRVLDAQYFGVPQRRRRVFVVGYLGDWRPAAAVLFELASLSGDLTPSRETGARVTNCVTPGAGKRNSGEDEYVVGQCQGTSVGSLRRGNGHITGGVPFVTTGQSNYTDGLPTLRAEGGDCAGGSEAVIAFDWQAGSGRNAEGKDRQYIVRKGDYTGSLQANKRDAVAQTAIAERARTGQSTVIVQEAQTGLREYDTAGSLRADAPGTQPTGSLLRSGMAVRRLLPVECERLQGFPDGYTDVPYRGKPAADGPRYKALGNSMATVVMQWLGERIDMVEAVKRAMEVEGTRQ